MTIPKTMHAVLLTGHGDKDKLEYREDIPVPEPGAGDVLIKVGAAAVNNTDINTRLAWYSKSDADDQDASWAGEPLYFPRIQGADVCGTIVAVGSGIDPQRVGDRVLIEPCLREANGQQLKTPWYFGSECDGGFAQYTVVASRHAHKINSNLTDAELASFPCSYSTAENMLTRADVKSSDCVLVTGASGGVGSAAVQLAKARGAEVVAVTTPEKSDHLLKLGADKTVFRQDDLIETLGTNSLDVIVDLVAGEQWPQFLELLRPFGRYAVAGAIGGHMVSLDVRTLYLKDLSFFGCTCPDPVVFTNLIERIETGKIAPLIAETFQLEKIGEAQEMFLQKQFIGKIVLIP